MPFGPKQAAARILEAIDVADSTKIAKSVDEISASGSENLSDAAVAG